ncbi:mechanosensitive ion channel protein MscS [Actibacterium pelagium]|uniref:Mechanosensitive ion channel protein MscS n=1 Tax=Actibacterium pelagium TaxID=2029103 RepID=A0A917EJV3_9RHOB|nr:mechanosensitive ion channel protein MscS [Actibacterium pelagium]
MVASEALRAGWTAKLDEIAEKLDQPDNSDEALSQIRDELDATRDEAREWISATTPALEGIQQQIDAMGPAPAEGEEPEPDTVAAKREELKDSLDAIAGPLLEADLVLTRVALLTSNLAQIRRSRFAARIFARGPSPVSPEVWKNAKPEITAIGTRLIRSTKSYVASPQFEARVRESLFALVAAVVFAALLVWPVHNWLLRRYGRDPSITKPNYMQALRATLVVGATDALAPTLAALLVYVAIVSAGLLTETAESIVWAIVLGIVLFSWTVAFFRASLAPRRPNWRIVAVPTNLARGIWWIVVAMAVAFAVDVVITEIVVAFSARLSVTALQDFGLSLTLGGLLLVLMLRQKLWRLEDGVGPPRWQGLRILAAVLIAGLLIAGAFGYVALARYVLTQVVLTSGLLILILILHRLGREFIHQALVQENWLSEWMHKSLEMDEASTLRTNFWLGLAYDIMLGMLGILVGLFLWGADRKDVAELLYQAVFGFQVGNFTFSLSNLFIAVVLFVGLVFVSRFVQRLLAERVLPQTQLDSGIRQSVKTAVGYVGIIIAAAAGFSALGLDLSNLAIVAGALSVGIGFGLQNVVNNFVSGLILLVERPVQVGDWVVVGGTQGYVKRIKVRATEIQTFDRASVFVPNSQLISDAVTNWTYADKMGRVIIPVGVAYGSNLRKIRDILTDIAHANPEVLKQPEPVAVFRGFGDSALNFELRCFLADIEATIAVTSDLCLAIDDAFREAEIEIPFPQRDIHIKQFGPEQAAGTKPIAPGSGPVGTD